MAETHQAARFHAGTLTDGWRWFGAHPAAVSYTHLTLPTILRV